MRNYTRKTKAKACTPEMLAVAEHKLAEGYSKRKIAAELGIDESTLRKRLKVGTGVTSLGRYKSVFTVDQEAELATHCRDLDSRFYGLTLQTLRKLGFDYAESNGIAHPFDKATQMAGKDWAYRFIETHNLALRTPQKTSLGRIMGFNKSQVKVFYDNLSVLYNKYKFPPSAIFNMDESGLSTVPNKVPKVITSKGKKLVGKVSSGDRGENITVVCSMSASGIFVPPKIIIFARKRMRNELLDGAPPETIAMCSDSGYVNCSLFMQWLRHFQEKVRADIDHPVLLLLDNHSSHLSLEAINFCRDHSIHLLTLPPHSSHKMQPLDRSFFGPLKAFYAHECNKWLVTHPGRNITPYQFCELFGKAYERCATLEKAGNAFRACGIWPINSDVFTDEDFLPSSVTDFAQNSERCSEESRDNRAESSQVDKEVDSKQSTCQKTQDIRRSVPNVDDPNPVTPPYTCEPSIVLDINKPGCSGARARTLVSPKEILPMPKRSEQTKRNKRSKHSEIISSSPYKNKMLEELKEKEKKIADKDERRKQRFGVQKGGVKQEKSAIQSDKIQCPGCEALYEDPPNEDWIQCTSCEAWWHENCSAYEDTLNFVCDLCQ